MKTTFLEPQEDLAEWARTPGQESSIFWSHLSFPVAQLVEHGARNAKIMGSIPRESKSW